MSIFKESADENLIQGRHILDSKVPAVETLVVNPLEEDIELPKVTFIKDVSGDETFKKMIIIPGRLSKIFLRIIPAYKVNEEIEGIDDLVTVEYQGKLHKVQSYSKRNCKVPIKNKTRVIMIDEAMPAIVVNYITKQLLKIIGEEQNGIIKTLVIGTSNDVSEGLYWKSSAAKNFKNGEFVSTCLANFLSYNNNSNIEYLIVPSEGPLSLPKVSAYEISEMCDQIIKTFKLDEDKSVKWKEDALKMWNIMGGEVVRSLYI